MAFFVIMPIFSKKMCEGCIESDTGHQVNELCTKTLITNDSGSFLFIAGLYKYYKKIATRLKTIFTRRTTV